MNAADRARVRNDFHFVALSISSFTPFAGVAGLNARGVGGLRGEPVPPFPPWELPTRTGVTLDPSAPRPAARCRS